MQRMKLLINSIKYSLRIMYVSSNLTIIPYLLLSILSVTVPLAIIYLLNVVLTGLTSAPIKTTEIFMAVIGYIVLIVVAPAINSASNILYNTLFDKARNQYDVELSEKLNKLPLSVIDTSEGKDLVDDVRYTKDTVAALPYQLVKIFTLLYSFIVAFTILLTFNVWFSLLFLVLTVPGIIIDKLFDHKSEELRLKTAPDVRKFSYYRWMLTDAWPAKDIRMYDLTEPLKERYKTEKGKFIEANKQLDKKKLFGSLVSELFTRSGEIVFTVYVIQQALDANITIGNIALYIGFAISASASFQTMLTIAVTAYIRTTHNMPRLFDFNKIECPDDNRGVRKLRNFESMTFQDVYFKYPLTEKFVLNGTSFSLNKGDKLSIIGINGSGKSTIIKLMLGLYAIDSGKILINGFPMQDYDIQDVRRLFSVLFQSFVQYPLTLRENIALSDLQREDNDEEIIEALKKSGIYENFDKFENGLDSRLTRQFDDDGIELSKGQWQKIALSRAYFKNSSIIIFDEPSAALDAEAEDRIFKNFETISDGKTGIMISHRISSARMSNKIIVLNNGIIEKIGTHEQLLAHNDLYAKFYNLQLNKYTIKEKN